MKKCRSLVFTAVLAILISSCTDGDIFKPDYFNVAVPPENECTDGWAAGEYPCRNIDMIAHIGPDEFQGDSLRFNDIWGWTDPETGREYALVGLIDGVSFVDISNPAEPVMVGKLEETAMVPQSKAVATPSVQKYAGFHHEDHEGKSTWRDFKVYDNHLFVVSDAQPHGLQVFDLTRLRDAGSPPALFSEDVHYSEFTNAHNIAINEETGYAYVTGSDTYGGGLHIVDIREPLDPRFAGFHSDSTAGNHSTGYVHDTQCVTYGGPDEEYRGDEICFNSSETHLVIANVTDKDSTYTIAKSGYDGVSYAHQGWLTEDHSRFLLDDEFDELNSGMNTRTYIWDVSDLDNPSVTGIHQGTTASIDHNQYVKGNYVYQTNYTSGLRILSLENAANGELEEVAWFDTKPETDAPEFDGAWSNYPFFESGVVIVSDVTSGLFILHPQLD